MKKFDKGQDARRIARKVLQPQSTRVIPDKRFKPPKHKKHEEDLCSTH